MRHSDSAEDYYGAACCIFEMVEQKIMNPEDDYTKRRSPNLKSYKWSHHDAALQETFWTFHDEFKCAAPDGLASVIEKLLKVVSGKVDPPSEAQRFFISLKFDAK